jgi:hypothetical protein
MPDDVLDTPPNDAPVPAFTGADIERAAHAEAEADRLDALVAQDRRMAREARAGGGGRMSFARARELGAEVPPDAVDVDPEAEAAAAYDGKTAEQLQRLVSRRGVEVTGSGAGGRVLKTDMIAALVASDLTTPVE